MHGVTSVIKVKKQKPAEEIRNLFSKKTYNMESNDCNQLNVKFSQRNIKPLFEFEGRIDEIEDRKFATMYNDDNIMQAIELRTSKQKHTDFFYKLHELKERLEVYNEVFRSKVPRYLQTETYKRYKHQKEIQKLLKEQEAGKVHSPEVSHATSSRQKDLVSPPHKHSQFKKTDSSDTHKVHLQTGRRSTSLEQPPIVKSRKTSARLEINDAQMKNQIQEVDEEQATQRSRNHHSQQPSTIPNVNASQVQEMIDNSKFPKIAQDRMVSTQYKQSFEKAIETSKKQEQEKSSRMNAFEKKMPPIQSLQNLKSPKVQGFQKFLNHNYSMNYLGSPNPTLPSKLKQDQVMGSKQNIDSANFIFTSQPEMKIELKEIKPLKAHPFKERSILIKSVYETNLLKEQFGSYNRKKMRLNTKLQSPNAEQSKKIPIEDGGNKYETPDGKILPPVTSNNKSINNVSMSGLQQSKSTNNLGDKRLKQISQLYHTNLLNGQGSPQKMLEKILKPKNQSSVFKGSDNNQQQNQDETAKKIVLAQSVEKEVKEETIAQ